MNHGHSFFERRSELKTIAVAAALALVSGVASLHAADMKGMDVKDMSPTRMAKEDDSNKHVAKGTVKSVDATAGAVTIAHEAVKSLNWPAMTMTFKVRDKALIDKLAAGKNVEVEFEQRGKDYVITRVK